MEPVVIITVPACGVKAMHKKHVLRHGFLHLRRTKCEGWTYDQWNQYLKMLTERDLRAVRSLSLDKKETPHKHRLEYKPSQKHLWVNPFRYVWVCKDQSCNHVISTEKSEFKHALLSEHVYHAQQVRVFHKPWPSS